MQFPDSKLLIFAKAPVAGLAKTRLAPALGMEGAAKLYSQLLESTVRKFTGQAIVPVACWCAPDASHPLFSSFASDHDVTLEVQQGSDLGERMALAAEETLRKSSAVVLIGGDCPELTSDHLVQALNWLAGGADAVLGPAEDGGYVLLGIRRFDEALFRDIPWGSGQVLELTRQRLAGLGWRWRELEPQWDVDRPEDLARYRELLNCRADA
ncbi:MAG: TIGR04282 family arsenosugar biosynthesis glycosyltransferase [Candidatus Sedimenticola sp. 20ELBAFRAG]